jgi:hypothetical protein
VITYAPVALGCTVLWKVFSKITTIECLKQKLYESLNIEFCVGILELDIVVLDVVIFNGSRYQVGYLKQCSEWFHWNVLFKVNYNILEAYQDPLLTYSVNLSKFFQSISQET